MTKTKRPTGRQMDLLKALKDGPLDYVPLYRKLYPAPKNRSESGGYGTGFSHVLGNCRERGWVKHVDKNGVEIDGKNYTNDFLYALTESGQRFANL